MIRSDNGTEFTCLRTQFRELGIVFQTSCTGTPQQNGRVERKHRHILNVARALRFQGNLPINFWGECILTAGYLINRTPTQLLDGKSPYEVLNGKPPSYEHLRVFGSLCYAHNQGRKGDKFASRSRKCVFVGYPHGKKGWKLYDLDTNTYFVSRDVHFFEAEFPFGQDVVTSSNEAMMQMFDEEAIVDTTNYDSEKITDVERARDETHVDVRGDTSPGGVQQVENPQQSEHDGTDGQPENEENVEQLGRGKRTKIPSVRLRDCVTNTVKTSMSLSTRSPTPQHQLKVRYPIANYANCDRFSLQHCKFIAAVTADKEPMLFAEAVKDSRWRLAMQEEIQALEDNNTWTLCSLPMNKKALGCKWVYKIKYLSDGTIERFKARLVILGNHQVEGIDYTETFAPVAKMVTVRTVLGCQELGTTPNGRAQCVPSW